MPLNLVSDSRPTPEFDTNQDCTPRPQAVCRTLLVAFSSIFLPPFVFLFLCSKQRRIVVLAVTQNPTVHKSVSALGTDTRTLDRALNSLLCEWTDSVQPGQAAVKQRSGSGLAAGNVWTGCGVVTIECDLDRRQNEGAEGEKIYLQTGRYDVRAGSSD